MAKAQLAESTASVGTTPIQGARTQFVLVHGDKGGVGKSTVAQVIADRLLAAKIPVAIIDADTRNPDVLRMFAEADCPRIALNLRATDGWMDAMDFVHQHPGHTFVLSMPAGIGESMQAEFTDFVHFLKTFNKAGLETHLSMWWVMGSTPDSVNLLERALQSHANQFGQVVVVRNTIFGAPESFVFWNGSPLKTALEKQGAITVDLPPLHERIMTKLVNPACVMPFSAAQEPLMAEEIGFRPSELHKLSSWLTVEIPRDMGKGLKMLGVVCDGVAA